MIKTLGRLVWKEIVSWNKAFIYFKFMRKVWFEFALKLTVFNAYKPNNQTDPDHFKWMFTTH